jgi:hypothetical protein
MEVKTRNTNTNNNMKKKNKSKQRKLKFQIYKCIYYKYRIKKIINFFLNHRISSNKNITNTIISIKISQIKIRVI